MTQQQPPVMRVFHGPGLDCGVQGCVHDHGSARARTSAVLAPALRNPVTGGTSWFHGASFDPSDNEDEKAPEPGSEHNLTSPHLPSPGGEHHDPGGTVRPPEEHNPDYGGFESGERIGHHWNTDLGSHFTSLQSVAKGFASGQHSNGGGPNSRVLHASLHMANPKHYADETEMAHHAIRWARENGHKFLGPEAEEGDHERFIDGEFGYEDGEDGDGPIGAHLDHLHDHTSPTTRSQIVGIDKHGPMSYGDRTEHLEAAEHYLGLHPEREEVTEGFRKHLQDQGHDGIVYGNDHEGPEGHACAIAFPDTPVHQKKWDWQHPSKQHLNEPEPHEPMPGQGQLPLQMHSNLRVAVRLTPGITREASVSVCQEVTELGYRMRMDDVDTGERLGSLQYANEGGTLRFWAVQAVNPSVARAMVEDIQEHVKTSTVLTDWRPNQRLFAPTKGDVDPRLFDESNRQMLPRVRSEILSLTDGFFASHGYGVRPSWARVFLAGSQASEWWGNRDFDILIGINYPLFRDARPQDAALSDKEVDDRFNVQLRDDFNDDTWHPDFDPDEAWSRTGYVNHDSWHIAKIHPYAAYDVTDGEWAVTPIHEPQGHTFADSEWYYFEGFAEQARHALALTGSARTQACSRLWEFVHSDRSRAFGPGGSGAFDYRNAIEKYLAQCPVDPNQRGSVSDEDSLMGALSDVRFGRGNAHQSPVVTGKEQKTAAKTHSIDEVAWHTGWPGNGSVHDPVSDDARATKEMVPLDKVRHVVDPPEKWGDRFIPEYVHEMSDHMKQHGSFGDIPPVVLFHRNGEHQVDDGHHRINAAAAAGLTHVPAYVFHVGKEQKTAAAGPDASLWPKHPVFQQGDRVTVSYGEDHPGSPGTVHHMVPSDSPDHEPTAWVTEDRDRERYGDRPIGVSQSRVQIHPDAPAEQHEHHQQQVAKNESGEPYVPEHERNIDENDRVTVHHLTGDPHFTPSSAHRPENNTTMGGSMSPRLFVGDAHSWAEGEYGYRRPYVAEISAPRAVVQNNGGYSGEKEIHARHFDKIQVKRVMPYDAHVRERYGVHGPAESYNGTTFDTDKKITPEQQRDADHGKRNFPVGYKWSGDTRDWSQQQHQEHVTRHNQYLKGEHGWDIEDDHEWGNHHESVLRRQAAKTAGLFGPSWYETAHDDDIDDHPAAAQIRGYMTHHTSPQGHVYRLTHDSSKYVTATYLGKGSNRIKKPQMVGRLSYFGGKANDQNNIEGRIHKVFVKPAHRRRGLASAMLDHARAMKKPGDDIEHSSALSEDGKAWSEKKASKTAGANGDLPDLHYQFHDANETGENAHHVEAWLPEHAGDWSECAPHARSVYHGSFLDPGHRPVGSISWDHQTGEIRGVYAVDEHKRKGVASELLRRAREIDPTVHHSEHLSDSGRAWSSKVGKTASADWDVTREYDPGYVGKFGHRYVLTAKDSDGNQQGRLRYHEPKRKGAPLHVDEVRGDAPGAASHLLNHMESLHPDASKTVFFGEKDARRHHNTPGHHDGEHGKPTDWDQHYDALGDIHRGLSIRLDSRDARTVNSPDHPAAEQAKALQGKIGESNAGIHWTAGAREAKNFAGRNQFDPRTDIPVVLHAHKPARKDIETRPSELFRNGTFPHDHVEKEVPVRRGRDLTLTGISWKPDSPHPEADEDGWLHHTFDEPIVKRAFRMTAGLDDDRYQMDHRPPSGKDGDGMPIHDLTTNFPADVYTHPHYYSDMSEPSNVEAHSVLRKVRDKPEAKVRIYRSLPAEHAHRGIQPGDWVTTSKEYAQAHGRHATDPKHDWPVVSATVPAKHLHTDGDDLREYGFNGDKAPFARVAYKGGYHQQISQKADGSISKVQRRPDSPIKGYSVTRDPTSYEDSIAGRGSVTATAPDGSHAGHMRYDEDGIFAEHVEPDHEHVGDHLKKKMRSVVKGDPFLKFEASHLEEDQ